MFTRVGESERSSVSCDRGDEITIVGIYDLLAVQRGDTADLLADRIVVAVKDISRAITVANDIRGIRYIKAEGRDPCRYRKGLASRIPALRLSLAPSF